MRGLFTPITKIRRQVFAEVAKFAFERSLDSTDFSYFYEAGHARRALAAAISGFVLVRV